MIHEMFPEEYIRLGRELASGLHPKLEPILTKISVEEIDLKLANIAAYCEVMLDDVYTLEDRCKLCDILTKKLIEKRERPAAIILSS